MSEPHRIHLREPWSIDGPRRTRKFGRPRLTAGERVWLSVEGDRGGGSASLNGEPIFPLPSSASEDVTEILKERNVLIVEGWGEFSHAILEIYCSR